MLRILHIMVCLTVGCIFFLVVWCLGIALFLSFFGLKVDNNDFLVFLHVALLAGEGDLCGFVAGWN